MPEKSNINHELIGHYVHHKKKSCLVTGAQKIGAAPGSQKKYAFRFRLCPTAGGDEYWTDTCPRFADITMRKPNESTFLEE